MKLRITIDGTTYEADVEMVDEEEEFEEGEEPQYEAPNYAVEQPDSASAGNGNECRSPVMGLVIRVEVETGQQVEAGQRVMVLEAMKMETHMTAPRACRVKSVHVAPGDPVKVDQLLIEFE
ncbi:MAG: acetyl-CoA carboxylase biotin carboxyl carrier protein subunit [Terracidiphilus sp.]